MTLVRTSAAEEPSADQRARLPTLLGTGASAAKAKDWQGCITALWEALSIEDSATIAGDLALCEENAGRFGDAYNHLIRAFADVTPDMRKLEPWRTYQAALSRVRPQVSVVWLTTRPVDARILIDGRPWGKADGQGIGLSYGKHTIVARKEGYEDASETRLFKPDGVPHVHLSLTPKPRVEPESPKAPSTPSALKPRAAVQSLAAEGATTAPPRYDDKAHEPAFLPCIPTMSARGVLVTATCVSAATFVVSAATAIGLEVHARSMQGALDARGFTSGTCAPGQPDHGSAQCTEMQSRMQQRTDAANVMIGTGIATAVLAVSAGVAIAMGPTGTKVTAQASLSGGTLGVEGT